MQLTIDNMTPTEVTTMHETLFSYWREGVKMKDILQNHKVWNEQLVSDQLKIVMDDYFRENPCKS